jgi:hypothetical protein
MFAVEFVFTFCPLGCVGCGCGSGFTVLPLASVAFHLSNAKFPRNTRQMSFVPETFFTFPVKSLNEPFVAEIPIVPRSVPV